MAGLHKSDIANPVINWIDTRMPIFTMMQKEYGDVPTPKNFNYFWNFGALAMINLVIMIATGVFLAMNYTAHTSLAFDSVERIMRDVNYGWLLRYVHANGASSMFFIVTYLTSTSSGRCTTARTRRRGSCCSCSAWSSCCS